MQYIKPQIKIEKFQMLSISQYTFLATREGCPSLAGSDEGELTGETSAHCDNNDLETIRDGPDKTMFVTCSNIDGTFEITIHNSETELYEGLNCSGDQISIIAPITVSPELPADCVVDSITEEGETGDICES